MSVAESSYDIFGSIFDEDPSSEAQAAIDEVNSGIAASEVDSDSVDPAVLQALSEADEAVNIELHNAIVRIEEDMAAVESDLAAFADESTNTPPPPAPPAYENIIGDDVLESAAATDYRNKLIAAGRPILHKIPLEESRDWQIDFGPASAPAGETLTFSVAPQCLFRGEKVIATDTATPPGSGTRISTITVGQRVQRPAGTSSLTMFFAPQGLANGIRWDTTDRALRISVTVSFIVACTFDMSVFGRAVL